MQGPLTMDDLDDQIRTKIYEQDYSPGTTIADVQIIPLDNHLGEEGDLSEVLKLTDEGEIPQVPGFKLRQINRTRLFPRSIKAWHVHLKQFEMWYVPPFDQLFVGLWDIRKNSKTKGKTMRINLGGGKSSLLFIPKGIAHGSANFSSKPVELYYFINQIFDIKNPDEKRIHWDAIGANFWQPQRD